jgi:DNA-binding NarL/FixJ family response regulator
MEPGMLSPPTMIAPDEARPALPVPLRILLVEDSRAIAERLEEMISSTPGMQLVGTVDAEADALATIAATAIDAVVLDLHLRVGNGLGVLRGLAATMTPAPVVIVLTNYAGAATRKTCMDLGAHCVMDKSWGVDETLGIIQELIPRFEPPASS